jgi:hypothetical protein
LGISRRNSELVRLAEREVSPRHVEEFEPITRGWVVAILGIMVLGSVAVLYMIGQKIAGMLGSNRK